jgi:hypothetical protein
MKIPWKMDGETICLILLAVAVFGAVVAAFIEGQSQPSRFQICPLCNQKVQ